MLKENNRAKIGRRYLKPSRRDLCKDGLGNRRHLRSFVKPSTKNVQRETTTSLLFEACAMDKNFEDNGICKGSLHKLSFGIASAWFSLAQVQARYEQHGLSATLLHRGGCRNKCYFSQENIFQRATKNCVRSSGKRNFCYGAKLNITTNVLGQHANG